MFKISISESYSKAQVLVKIWNFSALWCHFKSFANSHENPLWIANIFKVQKTGNLFWLKCIILTVVDWTILNSCYYKFCFTINGPLKVLFRFFYCFFCKFKVAIFMPFWPPYFMINVQSNFKMLLRHKVHLLCSISLN